MKNSIEKTLAPLKAKFWVRMAQHKDSVAIAETLVPVTENGGQGEFEIAENTLSWSLKTHPVTNRPDALDFELGVQHSKSWGLEEGSAALRLELGAWSDKIYVFAPGSVYAGNRFDVCKGIPYGSNISKKQARADGLPYVRDSIYHLKREAEESSFALKSGEMATPCVGFHDPKNDLGVLVLFEAFSEVGESAIQFKESANKRSASITVLAPGVREGQRNSTNPKVTRFDKGHSWNCGHSATLRCRIYAFPCADVPTLFARFAEVRRDLSGTPTRPAELPFSAAYEIVANKRMRQNWLESAERFETEITGDGQPRLFQLGWCGGFLDTMPLLRAGKEAARERVVRMLNRFLCKENHFPCGLWVDAFAGNERQTRANDHTACWTLIRQQADAFFAIAKHIAVLQRLDESWEIPEAWNNSIRTVGDAFCKIWKEQKGFGQWIDSKTGKIALGDTSSGALVPAGLALMSHILGVETWLDIALKAAERFARRELQQGYTNGGPGDALQVPDSESAFSLVETFATLHALTGDVRWAQYASAAADHASSWVMTQDHPMPPASPMGQIGAKTVGTVFANSQNRHSAPGICTLSGDGLLRLFRATGETRHIDLLCDIARALPQFVSRNDRPVGVNPEGWINERVNTCDWEAAWLRDVGDVFAGSCWCECSLLLTTVEVPSIYLRPDLGKLWVFDHLEAEIIGASEHSGSVRLRITNPTKFDAQVKVLVEDAHMASKPLGFDALWDVPAVSVAANSSGEYIFYRNDLPSLLDL
jgi:hypothetical protein